MCDVLFVIRSLCGWCVMRDSRSNVAIPCTTSDHSYMHVSAASYHSYMHASAASDHAYMHVSAASDHSYHVPSPPMQAPPTDASRPHSTCSTDGGGAW